MTTRLHVPVLLHFENANSIISRESRHNNIQSDRRIVINDDPLKVRKSLRKNRLCSSEENEKKKSSSAFH
jgi:hypothetical protein